MGRVKGLLFLLSPIFHCHKIKDGGYNNITNTNKVSPTQNTPALQARRYFSHLLNNRLRVGWIFLTFHFFEQILIPLEGSKNRADSTVVCSR